MLGIQIVKDAYAGLGKVDCSQTAIPPYKTGEKRDVCRLTTAGIIGVFAVATIVVGIVAMAAGCPLTGYVGFCSLVLGLIALTYVAILALRLMGIGKVRIEEEGEWTPLFPAGPKGEIPVDRVGGEGDLDSISGEKKLPPTPKSPRREPSPVESEGDSSLIVGESKRTPWGEGGEEGGDLSLTDSGSPEGGVANRAFDEVDYTTE